jgi:hypothetical protein
MKHVLNHVRAWRGLSGITMAVFLGLAQVPAVRAEVDALDLGLESLESLEASNLEQIERLSRLFDTGSAPEPKDILGWWSGRQFGVNRNTSGPSLLVGGLYSNTVRDDGPLFPPQPRTARFVIATHSQAGPDFFDDISRYRDLVLSYEPKWLGANSDARVIQSALTWECVSCNERNDLRTVTVPASREGEPAPRVLISRSTRLKDTQTERAGQTVYWNYYFKQTLKR